MAQTLAVKQVVKQTRYSAMEKALYTLLPAHKLCSDLLMLRGSPSLAKQNQNLGQRLLLGPQA